MLTVSELANVFQYHEDGTLTWLVKPRNSLRIGSTAGSIRQYKNTSYVIVEFKGVAYKAHSIVWMLHHGLYENKVIDHIDHNGCNNRISNLRLVTPAENNKNMRKPKNNTSGFVGVYFDKNRNTWNPSIRVNRRQIYLGRCSTKAEAISIRKAAELHYGFHPNHGAEQ